MTNTEYEQRRVNIEIGVPEEENQSERIEQILKNYNSRKLSRGKKVAMCV